jgi:hypothetical protein
MSVTSVTHVDGVSGDCVAARDDLGRPVIACTIEAHLRRAPV